MGSEREARMLLDGAIQRANELLSSKNLTVRYTNSRIEYREPVYLELKDEKGSSRKIGVVHLVHLHGKDWDQLPIEKIARTTGELSQAILDRVDLFLESATKELYIDEQGTIFDFQDIPIEHHPNHTFSLRGRVVTFEGKPLSLHRLKSEGIIECKFLPNGDVQLFDALDKRKGKGVFVNQEGEVYRG